MKKFPEWLIKKTVKCENIYLVKNILKELNVNTVCENALCPNLSECFSKKTAAFMILGNTCTRSCKFCAVKKGSGNVVDFDEPEKIAIVVKKLGMEYVVITSTTRDDLPDYGAEQFIKTIKAIHSLNKKIKIEILTPDFFANKRIIEKIVKEKPFIFSHNLETVPRLYKKIRKNSNYEMSLLVLKTVKEIDKNILTKSSLLLGLGEKEDEVIDVMKDLRSVNCDILFLGQYLAPTLLHFPVKEFIHPDIFVKYKKEAENLGFLKVSSSPFVRTSYRM